MTAFLVSVTTVDEALTAVECGAGIIDCKDPARGALGALPVATVAAIRAAVSRGTPVSATIGDFPVETAAIVDAAFEMAQSGCDLIKIGFFPGGDACETIRALGGLRQTLRCGIVGLLLADHDPDLALIETMAEAGFSGVMLDTAGKGGCLTDHMSPSALSSFISSARQRSLFSGLAGSLRISDIATLMRLKPNVLGFRGAVCAKGIRTNPLAGDAVLAVRTEMDRVADFDAEPVVPSTAAL